MMATTRPDGVLSDMGLSPSVEVPTGPRGAPEVQRAAHGVSGPRDDLRLGGPEEVGGTPRQAAGRRLRSERVFCSHRGHQMERKGLLGGDLPADKAELAGDGAADEVVKQSVGHAPEGHLGVGEVGRRGRDPQVAHGGEVAASGDGGPVDSGDCRQGELQQCAVESIARGPRTPERAPGPAPRHPEATALLGEDARRCGDEPEAGPGSGVTPLLRLRRVSTARRPQPGGPALAPGARGFRGAPLPGARSRGPARSPQPPS